MWGLERLYSRKFKEYNPPNNLNGIIEDLW
jgi:hypothetical protein